MKYRIRVVKQTDPQKEPFYAEATDEDNIFITAVGGSTLKNVLERIKMILGHCNAEILVHEEIYEIN
jgi:hypothetical protein